MSGAVGSRPSLMRSGTPVASERASLASQSACGNSSSQPRLEIAKAFRTRSVTGCLGSAGTGVEGKDIRGFSGDGRGAGSVYCAAAPNRLPHCNGERRGRGQGRHDSSGRFPGLRDTHRSAGPCCPRSQTERKRSGIELKSSRHDRSRPGFGQRPHGQLCPHAPAHASRPP